MITMIIIVITNTTMIVLILILILTIGSIGTVVCFGLPSPARRDSGV